jgi:hypothetical protein
VSPPLFHSLTYSALPTLFCLIRVEHILMCLYTGISNTTSSRRAF